jgi:hypothetical protein
MSAYRTPTPEAGRPGAVPAGEKVRLPDAHQAFFRAWMQMPPNFPAANRPTYVA